MDILKKESRLEQQAKTSAEALRGVLEPGEDSAWNRYMAIRRKPSELADLLRHEDTPAMFESRALQVLLTCDISKLPFHLNVDTYNQNLLSEEIPWRDILDSESAAEGADLIQNQLNQVKGKIDSKQIPIWSAYNDLIPVFLPFLEQHQATTLFRDFDIVEIESYVADRPADFEPQYKPLERLVNDPLIKEPWKRKAASKMRGRIGSGEVGSPPDAPESIAARRYREIVYMMTELAGTGKIIISQEFIQREINFVDETTKQGANIVPGQAIDRGQMGAMLKGNAEHLDILVRSLQNIVFFVIDAINNKVLYLSPGCESTYGRSRQDFIDNPRTWREFIHPDDIATVSASWPKLYKGDSVSIQHRIIRPDGEVRWLRGRLHAQLESSGMQFERLYGAFLDVTESQQAEARLHSVAHLSADAITSDDQAGNITSWNRAAKKIFG